MSMSQVFNIAGSALTAQTLRLNTVASNMANLESAASSNGPVYKARQVVFQPTPLAQGGVGVEVAQVIESDLPPKLVYDPKHPAADKEGYVRYPNADPVEEMVNMISASRSYQNNVEVMSTAKGLMQKLLTLGQ